MEHLKLENMLLSDIKDYSKHYFREWSIEYEKPKYAKEPTFNLKRLTCDTNYVFTLKAVSLGTDAEPASKLINVEVGKRNKLSIICRSNCEPKSNPGLQIHLQAKEIFEDKDVPFEWSCSLKDGTLIPIETLREKSAEEDLLIKPNALKEST
uniref:REJ domain-containing protein n=2 Tax=Rhodnius prolixus TaxID=13249 RepID=T1I3I7_RHOPR